MRQSCLRCAAAMLSLLLSACASPHGQPARDAVPVAPNQILEFSTLYADNCAGCHGAQGRGGAAIALGTSMPAFAERAGGMLTGEQIEVISDGIFSRWAQKGILNATDRPSYSARNPGTAANGGLVYRTYCASCHGSGGQGGPKGSAITNDSFLALVSDQTLRTIAIVGRPELGAPDWRGNVPGKPMSDQEITDLVAWLASYRVQSPGQPYSAANHAQ